MEYRAGTILGTEVTASSVSAAVFTMRLAASRIRHCKPPRRERHWFLYLYSNAVVNFVFGNLALQLRDLDVQACPFAASCGAVYTGGHCLLCTGGCVRHRVQSSLQAALLSSRLGTRLSWSDGWEIDCNDG